MPDRIRTDLTGVVEITLPRRHEFASPLRVLAAATGADVGFSVDDIDDVRLALSEVFTLLVEMDGDEPCQARFDIAPGQLTISLGRGNPDDTIQLDALASTILSSVVDEFSQADGAITIVKRVET